MLQSRFGFSFVAGGVREVLVAFVWMQWKAVSRCAVKTCKAGIPSTVPS